MAAAVVKKIGLGIVRVLIVLLLAIEVYPVLWLVLSSFKTTVEFAIEPMFALPKNPFYFNNYVYAWTMGKVGVLFKNTVIVTVASLLLVLLLSSMAAFALSKMRWKLSGTFSLMFRLGMFIPSFVLLLPQFLLFKDMGILNTLWALIVAFGCNTSLAIYLLTGFYRYIPDEIMEASIIDGCNIYSYFLRIAVPLSKNGYVTVMMLTFFNIWNNLLISQTFVSSQSQKMLQAGLASYLDSQIGREWGPTFAAISIAVVPTVVIYLALNKRIMEGVTAGAIKG